MAGEVGSSCSKSLKLIERRHEFSEKFCASPQVLTSELAHLPALISRRFGLKFARISECRPHDQIMEAFVKVQNWLEFVRLKRHAAIPLC